MIRLEFLGTKLVQEININFYRKIKDYSNKYSDIYISIEDLSLLMKANKEDLIKTIERKELHKKENIILDLRDSQGIYLISVFSLILLQNNLVNITKLYFYNSIIDLVKESTSLLNYFDTYIENYKILTKDYLERGKDYDINKFVYDEELDILTIFNLINYIEYECKQNNDFIIDSILKFSYGNYEYTCLWDILNNYISKFYNPEHKSHIEIQKDIIENFNIIFPNYEFVGKEISVKNIGKIDILAKDKKSKKDVIIEIKSNNQSPIQQLISYSYDFKNPILIAIGNFKDSTKKNFKKLNINNLSLDELYKTIILGGNA